MSAKLKVLKKARDLIVNKGWTKGSYARNDEGEVVALVRDDATCFCSLGAIRRATWELEASYNTESRAEYALRSTLQREGLESYVPWFNDDEITTKEKVVDMFDKTIARLSNANHV